MKRILAAIIVSIFFGTAALAQTSPNLIQNQVLTPAQWNALFTAKQDYLGAPPLLITGGVMTGELGTAASTTINSGFNIPPGTAPTTPVNGDIWTTPAGIFVQVNGGTVGPLLSAATPCTICALTNNANNFSVAQVVNINGGTLAAALTGTVVRAANANSIATRFEADAYGATSYFSAVAYGGTLASPTALGSGVEIGGLNGWGYNGTAVVGPSAAFRLFTNGIWSGTSQPTYADIALTPAGSTSEIEVVKFTATSTTAVNAQIGTAGSIVGSLSFGNATSGTITISPATGALGSGVATLAAGTYNLVGDNLTQTLTNKTITSTSDVLGGVTMGLGSDATGDIYYNNGGIFTRLPKGVNGQALELVSGLPSWQSLTGTGTVNTAGTGLTLTGGGSTLNVSLSTATNVLSGNVSLSNTSNYFDGPSMAQGTTGTWFASGTVTLTDTAGAAQIFCKLWDGTTVIASSDITIQTGGLIQTMHLAGTLASPAANIRISCRDINSASGLILFNATSNSKDASIFGIRIN
jgi:hypothetical protein